MEDIVPVQLRENQTFLYKLLPLLLCVGVVVIDQVSKILIVKYIEPYTIGASFLKGFLRIVHVYNTGIAFSIGTGLPEISRRLLFAFIPLCVLIFVLVVYFKSNDFTKLQQWSICGIVGGGLGNLIDRFFRPLGVVDWIDVRFFGLFGRERFPTFNIADSSVVICGFLLILSFILFSIKEHDTQKKDA